MNDATKTKVAQLPGAADGKRPAAEPAAFGPYFFTASERRMLITMLQVVRVQGGDNEAAMLEGLGMIGDLARKLANPLPAPGPGADVPGSDQPPPPRR